MIDPDLAVEHAIKEAEEAEEAEVAEGKFGVLPPLDETKSAYENSLFSREDIEISTRNIGIKYLVDLINVAERPELVFGIDDLPSRNTSAQIPYIASVDQLRKNEWQQSDLPQTEGPGMGSRGNVMIEYSVDENGRMSNIKFPEAYSNRYKMTPDRMEKWTKVLQSLKFEFIEGSHPNSNLHKVTYSSVFFLRKLYRENRNVNEEVVSYKKSLLARQQYLEDLFEAYDQALKRIASKKAEKLAKENEVRLKRAEAVRIEAARVAERERQEAARIAYEKSPAGIKARAAINARYAAKMKARKGEGWPDNAVARIAGGSWVCGKAKSAMRMVMDERTGNQYAYTPSDCSNATSNLYVRSKSPRGGGMYQVGVIGAPGIFYTGSSQLEE